MARLKVVDKDDTAIFADRVLANKGTGKINPDINKEVSLFDTDIEPDNPLNFPI